MQAINVIRSKELNHRQFRDFLQGIDSDFSDVLYHANARWLSLGSVLKKSVNVIYEPCHWFSCFCTFSKVTVNVLDVIVVRKLSPSKLLCLPPHLIDCHL